MASLEESVEEEESVGFRMRMKALYRINKHRTPRRENPPAVTANRSRANNLKGTLRKVNSLKRVDMVGMDTEKPVIT